MTAPHDPPGEATMRPLVRGAPRATREAVPAAVPLWMRFRGERRLVVASGAAGAGAEGAEGKGEDGFVARVLAGQAHAEASGAALAYGFVADRAGGRVLEQLGWESLGKAPVLVRPLRLAAAAERLKLPAAARALLPSLPLLAPFGRRPRAGVRDISALPEDVRITRLWDRFSVDVGVAVERTTSYFGWRIHDRPDRNYRILIVEDGDRYAIRAICIFRVKEEGGAKVGQVLETLHDRSVTGMRAASHLLGLALREMSDAGADTALAWSLAHSGSYPIYARHAFFQAPEGAEQLRFGVKVLDPDLEDLVTARDRWYVSGVDDLNL